MAGSLEKDSANKNPGFNPLAEDFSPVGSGKRHVRAHSPVIFVAPSSRSWDQVYGAGHYPMAIDASLDSNMCAEHSDAFLANAPSAVFMPTFHKFASSESQQALTVTIENASGGKKPGTQNRRGYIEGMLHDPLHRF